jgi:hypothetical protein
MPSGAFALCNFSFFADHSVAADTIRILIATDSHVGYEERDPIRKDDSWRSFDEVMQLARTQDVRLFPSRMDHLLIIYRLTWCS